MGISPSTLATDTSWIEEERQVQLTTGKQKPAIDNAESSSIGSNQVLRPNQEAGSDDALRPDHQERCPLGTDEVLRPNHEVRANHALGPNEERQELMTLTVDQIRRHHPCTACCIAQLGK